MQTLKTLLGLLASFVIFVLLFLLVIILRPQDTAFWGATTADDGVTNYNQWIAIIYWMILYFAMIGRVISGALFRRVERNKRRSSTGGMFQFIRDSAMLRGILASPILFGSVYLVAKNQPDPVMTVIFAFQNGFFCDSLLGRIENQVTAQVESNPSAN